MRVEITGVIGLEPRITDNGSTLTLSVGETVNGFTMWHRVIVPASLADSVRKGQRVNVRGVIHNSARSDEYIFAKSVTCVS